MATEADVPEPISATQRVGDNIYLASGQSDKTIHETSPGELKKLQETHNLPCETAECSPEPQEADKVGAETINTVIKGNVETPEGERFLESPSVAVVDTEETCMISKHCQADEESFQEDKEMSENKKKMQNNTTNEIAQETGSGENKVVEELEEIAENNDRSHEIVHFTGTSLQAARIEESNLGNRGEGSLEDESYVDQHVEVIEDQHESDEDKSTNKETRDMQKNEKDGDASLESNKQVLNKTEVTLDQNKETLIHIPDPGVISLNKVIDTAAEPCNKAESIKDKFTGEELGKKSSKVDDTEAEKSTNLVGEEESPEATRLREREENEDDESSVHEAGPETGEKLKEVSSISCEEKNKNKIEPSERMDQTSPVEDEMNHKNNIETCFAVQTEETCLQKVDNPELLKVVPRSWSDDIIKESPKEVKEKIEMIEKTAEGDSTSNEKGKDYENPEQKEESSFMKHEGTTGIIEVQAATDIPSGENRDEGGSTVVVAEDNTDDTKLTDDLEHNQSGKSNRAESSDNVQQNEPEMEKLDESLSTVAQDFSIAASNKYLETINCDEKEARIKSNEETFVERMIDASQQSQSGMTNHEERPEQLQQNEPEKEKLDGSSNLVNVDFGTTTSTECAETIPCAQEEAPIKSHEESSAEKMEEDLQTRSEPTIETGIPKDKNVPAIEMNEKIDDVKVRVLSKDANDLHVTYPSIEAAVQGKDLDQISNFESEGQTHEEHKASTEQKHIEEAPEVCQNSNCTISEHTSTETERVSSEPIPTSETNMTKLQEACRLDSEEAWHTVIHEILAKGDYAGKDKIDAEASVEVNRAICLTDEMVEQKFHIESPLPAAPTLSEDDKIANMSKQGAESIEQETVENPQCNINNSEESEAENNTEYTIEDSNIRGLISESVETDPPKNLNDEKMKDEKSSGEEKIEQNPEEDDKIVKLSKQDNVTYIPEESVEQETVESTQGSTNNAENSEADNNKEYTTEDGNIRGHIPESVEQDPVKNLNDEKMKAEKSSGEGGEITQTINESEDTGKKNIEEGSVADSNIGVVIREIHEEDSLKNENKEKEHEEEVDDSNLAVIEKIESTSSAKETVSETLKDRAESNVTSRHLDVTEASEEETNPREIKEDLVEKSVLSSEAYYEDSKEEIAEKEEIKFNYLDSVSVTEVKEEADLQQAEAEDRNRVESLGPVSEEKGIAETETREITLESGDMKVKPEDTSNLSKMMDKDIPVVADEDRKDKDMQNEVPRAGSEDQEEVTTNTMPLKGEDELIEYSTMASEEHKLKSSEARETVDETPEKIQAPDENEGTTSVAQEIDEILMQKHDKATNPLIVSESRSIDTEKETANENPEEDDKIVKLSKQDNVPYISVESVEPETVESSQGSTNNAEISEADNTKEYTIEEGNIRGLKPESIEQDPVMNLNDEKMKAEKSSEEGGEITQTINESEDTGKKNIEEGSVADGNIEVVIREIHEEDSLKNENKGKQHEEEVDDSNSAVIEKIESTSSARETVSETLKDRAESNVTSRHLDVTEASEEETNPREIKEDLVEKSVLSSEAYYEDSKEEIAEKEEIKFNYLDSVSVTEVKEEADLQQAEAEDKNRVESLGPVSEEKGIAETETREITLESGDMKVKPEDTSLSEMMDKDIPVVAEDRKDKDMQNEVPRAGSEDQEEVTTNTMPLKGEDELIEYSTMASEEHKLKSSEARETVDETPEKIQAPDENEGTTSVAQEIDEILMQKQDNATNPLIVSESRSIDTEKETANANPEEDDKIVKLSKQDNVPYISVESVEQETVESSQGSTNNAEISEADNTKEYTIEDGNIRGLKPESIEQDPVMNLNDEKMKAEKSSGEGGEITQTINESEDTGKRNIEEGSVADSNIEVVIRETDGEDSLKNENKGKEHEEEVDDSSPAVIEKIESTSSAKETVRAESNVASHHLDVTEASEEETNPREIKEDLVEKTVLSSVAFYEDSKEEIEEKEETKFNYADSVSVTEVKEEADLQEAEAEDRNRVESFGPVSEEKGIAETETREVTLESGDMKVKPEDTSTLSEMMDKDIPVVAD
ncbi:hypothetical protein Dsin_030917 [Dipteronia sinensis]|uniref:Uncharacterized protein n=1 Tax=Dipteronia sinensis TaxID=43782 RepID=A0AAE0DRK9_9ROSI|nr:hypothetical protein Dsin_030917 [Dipteronia sinensis]